MIAVDVRPEVVRAINNGSSHINEPGLNELINKNVKDGRLKATSDSFEALKQSNAVIISVQTPIGRNKKPNLSYLIRAIGDVGKCLKRDMIVVVSSTVPPGTMYEVVKPMLESMSGLRTDEDFYLAYVPERIAPGKTLKEFVENPRLVGGVGPKSTKVVSELFRTVCKKVIETDAKTSEVAKLAENTFRYVNIAFANQLALLCEQYGVDAAKIIELANTHPRVNIHSPGPGVGGPCLPKDPFLLLNKAKIYDALNIVKVARRLNDYMAKHVVKVVVQALKDAGKTVKESKTAILGIAYKGDVDDARLSPSETVIRSLVKLEAKVVAYDPYCKESFGIEKADSIYKAVEKADCIIIMTDHTVFKNLDLKQIKLLMNKKPVIVDGKRIVNPFEAEDLGFMYYGVGYGHR